MKAALKHIALLLAGLFASIYAEAQDSIEMELARYEMVCSMCLDLKSRIHCGEEVSREEATSVLNIFVGLNGKLKARKEEMTPAQVQRFENIGKWFSSGRRPTDTYHLPALNFPYLEHRVCSAATDTIKIMMPVECEIAQIPPEPMSDPALKAFFLIEMAAPDYSYGLRAGIQHGRWGAYLALRTNFRSGNSDYTCTSDGKLPSGGMLWASQAQKTSNNIYSAGALYKASSWLSIYAGGGYGRKDLLWEDIDGRWVKVTDCSYKGAAAEAGVLMSWKRIAFSTGISTISFKTASFCCGIGLIF